MRGSTPKPRTDSWRTHAPIYQDIATVIEREVLSGKWRPGDRIPAEPELMERFGASRGTLRLAIAELVKKGLLYRQSGRGTFVLDPELESVTRFFRFEHLVSDEPIVLETRVLEQGPAPADAATAEALDLAQGAEIMLVRRLRFHGGQPFLIVDSHFPPAVWKGSPPPISRSGRSTTCCARPTASTSSRPTSS